MTYKNFSKIIKNKRILAGISQKDFATILYISNSRYNKIENGSVEPNFCELLLICKHLKISLDKIINEYVNNTNLLYD